MIGTVTELISEVQRDLRSWRCGLKPWFRGESGTDPALLPKIAKYPAEYENYILQTFRRKAEGLIETPHREETDKWLFLAQHYGMPTRLLDWSEGLLPALFFAVNRNACCPRVYMLDPFYLNKIASGTDSDYLNFPISWQDGGYENIALAWEERSECRGYELPIAVPATYQDRRMIAQRSCFTIHGSVLEPMAELLSKKVGSLSNCLVEYNIDADKTEYLMDELSLLGISSATLFPDLDHLARDISMIMKEA